MNEKVLVTGGTGFLGLNIILNLLNRGYDVKTTIRKESGKNRIMKVLSANKVKNLKQLSFIEADLSSDKNWSEAMKNRKYVFSVASPVFFDEPKDETEAIQPALKGTMRILQAAQAEGVKRVIMTSNFGAVGFSKQSGPDVVTDERDWTDENVVGLSIYEKSKLLAEKAAWNYVNQPDVTLELSTINPVAILGSSLDSHVSGSFELLTNLISGLMKRIPDLPLNVVDVRDVAEIHIRAMEVEQAAGKRFIATDDGQISLKEIARLIKQKYPELSQNITSRALPNWLVDILAIISKEARSAKLMRKMNRNVSNQQARTVLGWTPQTDNEQAILDAVDSLIKYQLV